MKSIEWAGPWAASSMDGEAAFAGTARIEEKQAMPGSAGPRESIYVTFAELVGIELTRCADGECTTRVAVRRELLHGGGVVQGGVFFTMADSGMAAALHTVLDPTQGSATIEVKISYLEAVTKGTLVCNTRVVRRGKRIAFTEAKITEADRLVATATGSFAILDFRS